MKKLLLSVVFALSIHFVQAQNCTPTWPQGGGAGIIPDSATNLPVAYELIPYSSTVYFKVPKDTVATLGGFPVAVTIQNITITSVSGLSAIPAFVPFTYVTNPGNGIFEGDSVGCALITGTAAAGSSGVYTIQFSVVANAIINLTGTPVQQPYTIDYYKIVVQPDASVQVINGNEVAITSVSPNPAINSVTIQYYTPVINAARMVIYNSIGQIMQDVTLNPSAGLNTYNVDVTQLPAGNYLAGIIIGNDKLSTQFTVTR
jgi:hypothetical protein